MSAFYLHTLSGRFLRKPIKIDVNFESFLDIEINCARYVDVITMSASSDMAVFILCPSERFSKGSAPRKVFRSDSGPSQKKIVHASDGMAGSGPPG